MEPWLWSGARGQRLPGPAASGSSRIHTRFLLFLLLLLLLLLPRRPEGCLARDEAPGTLSTRAWTRPGVPCDPKDTCPPGRLRFPRQDDTESTTTQTTAQPASTIKQSVSFPSCGRSYEADPTIRDPEAMTRRWPWMVSVQTNGKHICAGILIASQWVLTVAHCLTKNGVNYTVRVGSPWINQTSKTSSDIPVLKVIINGKYQAQRYWSWVGRANDIGLLKLQVGLNFSQFVWPICLPGLDFILEDNAICTVTGWGFPKANGMWPQFLTLQEKDVTILNSRECERFYHNFSKIPFLVQIITTQMICVLDRDREHFCYEITGEPLVCFSDNNRWYLMGMMSWGAGCNKTEAPPIFLQVSSFQPWIWDRINGQTLLVPSKTLLLVLTFPLSFLAAV